VISHKIANDLKKKHMQNEQVLLKHFAARSYFVFQATLFFYCYLNMRVLM